jgi:hypothetical protein
VKVLLQQQPERAEMERSHPLIGFQVGELGGPHLDRDEGQGGASLRETPIIFLGEHPDLMIMLKVGADHMFVVKVVPDDKTPRECDFFRKF